MGRPKSNRAALIAGLEACGWRLDTNNQSKKYVAYVREGTDRRFLVGKSGALRVHRCGTPIDQSISLTDSQTRKAYINVGLCDGWTSREQAQLAYDAFFGGKKNELGLA